jgi:ribulose-phosphate 3-epimerase
MSQICPTITAFDETSYDEQLKNVRFAYHLHIDLMDGILAPTKSPELNKIWWPNDHKADIHLMYKQPMDYIDKLISLAPNMVIIQAEADVHHMYFAAQLHRAGMLAGLAVLQDTTIDSIERIIHSFDQILIFSGHLGYHGGVADLELLHKVKEIKKHHPDVEIAWDGGINDQNAMALVESGIDVLNVGGYIQNSPDPEDAYAKLTNILKGVS